MKQINIHEAKTHLSKLLESVSGGEKILIAKAGKPIAILSPFYIEKEPRKLGKLANKIKLSQDFDILPNEFIKHFA